jgi:S1-C subfamily serine protease
MATELVNLSNELVAASELAAASIVAVHGRRGIGSSGIAWRDNLIVTSSEGIRVEEGIKLLLPDGRIVAAKLRGRDSGTDLAVLETEASGLRPLEFAGDAALKVGQLALAVGRTANTGPIASFGIISGVSGEWKTWRGGKINPFVRLDISVI